MAGRENSEYTRKNARILTQADAHSAETEMLFEQYFNKEARVIYYNSCRLLSVGLIVVVDEDLY
jgi:hypothetical protein